MWQAILPFHNYMRNDRVVHLYANVIIQMYIELVECVGKKKEHRKSQKDR